MQNQITLQKPTVEYHLPDEAIGIGESTPRISWKILSAPAEFQQREFQLRIVRYDSENKKVLRNFTSMSDQQVLVAWPDDALRSREKFSVSVRVSDGESWSEWSEWVDAESGLNHKNDWQGEMICSPFPADRFSHGAVFRIRKEFTLSGEVASARLYTTAHGLFEAELNGLPVSSAILQPGWTSYNFRLRYITNDVTSLVKSSSKNVLGFWLADGWYKGRFGFLGGQTNIFGDRAGLLSQLEITYADGRTEMVSTDTSWKFSEGPVSFSGLYDGEHYDASLKDDSWSYPDYDDTHWLNAKTKAFNPDVLVAPDGPLVKCTDIIRPLLKTQLSPNRILVDFGQNFSGRTQIQVRGTPGDKVTIRHAEILQEGKLCLRPLREAAAKDIYLIGSSECTETWEPKFTIHGFRYAEVEFSGKDCELIDIVGKIYHTDMTRTGYFSCSDPMLNKLFENVVWSMRSNFVDIPTDCPQRDERLGWTGDLQVFGSSAAFLYDVRGMLSSWLKDLSQEQREYGNVPWYVPYVPGAPWPLKDAGNVWGDVATITPWELSQLYADAGFIQRQYSSARQWVEKVLSDFLDDEFIVSKGVQLADWLEPDPLIYGNDGELTEPALVATAYTLKSLKILSEMAKQLGCKSDVERYSEFYTILLNSFRKRYFPSGGHCTNPTQTAYSLAIVFGLLEESSIRSAGCELAALVRRNEGRIGTGFAGTLVVLDALTHTGHVEEAFMLIQCRECPSWLYQVDMGATTIWERWDSMLPDGTVNPDMMTSFNHYALGAVIKWLYQTVGGLQMIQPGYKEFMFKPCVKGGLTFATTQLETPFGRIVCHWEIRGGIVEVAVTVPVGSLACIELPDKTVHNLSHGSHHLSSLI